MTATAAAETQPDPLDISNTIATHENFFLTYNQKKNSLLDKASIDIKATEDLLRKAKITEEYSVPLDYSGKYSYKHCWYKLGWVPDKHNNLRLQFGTLDRDQKLSWKPLIETYADSRLLALNGIPTFLRSFAGHLEFKLNPEDIPF